MTLRAAWAGSVLLLLAVPLWGTAMAQTPPAPANAAAPNSAIADCSAHPDGRPTGLSELEKDCPQLQAALEQAQLRPLIIDSSRARFDRHSLEQLRMLTHSSTGRAPDVAALTPILRGLTAPRVPPRAWWQRLWDWLIAHFTQQQDASAPWLTDLMRLALRARWLWNAIIWCTLIALPVAIGIIVWREVRAMGRRSNDELTKTDATRIVGPSQSRLAALRAAPLTQRPALLFALLIGQLVAAGRLPPDRSLTHREVARKALLDDAEQRRLIETLARVSERQLYAGVPDQPAGLAELLARGEDLYTTGWGRPMEELK
jgi:hypothetical protein